MNYDRAFRNLSSTSRVWIYAIFSQALWGTGGVTVKLISSALPGSLLVGMFNSVASAVLGLAILNGKRHVLKGLPVLPLIALGLLAVGLPDLLFIEAIRRCGAIIATMLARIDIPLGVIFAHVLLKEKVTRLAYLATALSISGVWLISYRPGEAFNIHEGFYLGVVLGLTTAVMWGLSGVYAKSILRRGADPLAVTFVRQTVGAAFGLAVAVVIVRHPLQILEHLAIKDWVLVVYLGALLSGLAYVVFYKSLKVLDAHVMAILGGLSIVIVLLLGHMIGETLTALQWAGIICVVASIYLVNRRKPVPAVED